MPPINPQEVYTADGQRFRIPDDMMDALLAYITVGVPVGGFLEAVLSNDLAEAVRRADDHNIGQLPAYVFFLYNQAPGSCWGSREAYLYWLNKKAAQHQTIDVPCSPPDAAPEAAPNDPLTQGGVHDESENPRPDP